MMSVHSLTGLANREPVCCISRGVRAGCKCSTLKEAFVLNLMRIETPVVVFLKTLALRRLF